MKIGYARVSTKKQRESLASQTAELEGAGCERVFSDIASGSRAHRAGLAEALDYLREGDELVIIKLDRLGRTMRKLVELSAELADKEVHLVSLGDGIDTTTPVGKLYFHILSAIAEMELALITERNRLGTARAKARGTRLGRKPALNDRQVQAARLMLAGSPETPAMTRDQVAGQIGVSVATLYRYVPGMTPGDDVED